MGDSQAEKEILEADQKDVLMVKVVLVKTLLTEVPFLRGHVIITRK